MHHIRAGSKAAAEIMKHFRVSGAGFHWLDLGTQKGNAILIHSERFNSTWLLIDTGIGLDGVNRGYIAISLN